MADGNTLLRLNIKPVDSLFFRDARPFEPSSHAASGLPMPQTLAGAVRSVLLERHGADFGRLGERTRSGASFAEALAEFCPAAASVAAVQIRGPWFTLNGEVLLPAPASLQQEKESRKLVRLDPLCPPPPGWRPPAPEMLPLWRYGQETVEAADGFLRLCDLARFLEGGWPKSDAPALAKNVLVPAKNVYEFEDRTGIGVDPLRNAAQEGHIYAVRMLVLKPEAGLSAELSGPADALTPLKKDEPVVMKFGGEGRHVVVQAEQRGFDWPHVPSVSDKGRLVLLTTPAWFNGWKPPALDPIAAAVGRHQAVSGWDLAKGGPKPNRFMVPAGSVYFLPPDAQVPAQLVTDEDAKLGWGCFLKGNWSYV